ncbi:hypothetical protein ACLB2K_013155 [Fragaria x ananassa]
MWRLSSPEDVQARGDCYMFTFSNERDVIRVKKGGPWVIRGQCFLSTTMMTSQTLEKSRLTLYGSELRSKSFCIAQNCSHCAPCRRNHQTGPSGSPLRNKVVLEVAETRSTREKLQTKWRQAQWLESRRPDRKQRKAEFLVVLGKIPIKP